MKEKGILEEKTYEFSLLIVKACQSLENQRQYNLASQLFRSGTSIGANVREAGNSESRLDFIHKLKIAIKEAEETEFWLDLLRDTTQEIYEPDMHSHLNGIIRILAKSITTAKRNHRLAKSKS